MHGGRRHGASGDELTELCELADHITATSDTACSPGMVCDGPLCGGLCKAASVRNGSVAPVLGQSQRLFGCGRSRGVARLTAQEAGAVIGEAEPRKTASGQSRPSIAAGQGLRSVFARHTGFAVTSRCECS
jgi:hypothetical protein